jgi:hypothetical protein
MTDSNKESATDHKVWNSLEFCKLAATDLTPLTVFILGYVIWNGQRDIVQRWERDQIEQRKATDADVRERDLIRGFRLSIYREAAPLLNDILTYHLYIGRWKERTPADIIGRKRRLDELMYSNAALFIPAFFNLYQAFMRQPGTAGNHYGESRIRSHVECQRPHLGNASESWTSYFTQEDNRRSVCLAYTALIGGLSKELLLLSLKSPNVTEVEQISVCRDPMTSANADDSRRCMIISKLI